MKETGKIPGKIFLKWIHTWINIWEGSEIPLYGAGIPEGAGKAPGSPSSLPKEIIRETLKEIHGMVPNI